MMLFLEKLTLSSQFDGENTAVMGTIQVDGVRYKLRADGSASARGTDFYLNEVLVTDTRLADALEEALTDIWPDANDGNFTAEVVNGKVVKIGPAVED